MRQPLHFISGLPRSGSTLLAAILRQNPAIHAAMSSPLNHILMATLGAMGPKNEYHSFIDDGQRNDIAKAVVEAFYRKHADKSIIFDTNRAWSAQAFLLSTLYPDARIICCVRNPAWILDSIERQVRRNPLQFSSIFNSEPMGNVYERADHVMTKGTGLFGFAWNSFRQAWQSEQSDRLIMLRYDSLVENPQQAVRQLYDLLGMRPFRHNFDNVTYSEPEFDRQLGAKGLHEVAKKVSARRKETILPPDLFDSFNHEFWNEETFTTQGRAII